MTSSESEILVQRCLGIIGGFLAKHQTNPTQPQPSPPNHTQSQQTLPYLTQPKSQKLNPTRTKSPLLTQTYSNFLFLSQKVYKYSALSGIINNILTWVNFIDKIQSMDCFQLNAVLVYNGNLKIHM